MSNSLLGQIKANRSRVFRRLYIKRRQASDGQFEDTWTEITKDVLRWGKITRSVDASQYNKFKFGGLRFQVANDSGRYNPETNPSSLWFGYLSPQRSLVRVEAGFVHETLGADGIWTRTEYPRNDRLYREDGPYNIAEPGTVTSANVPSQTTTGKLAWAIAADPRSLRPKEFYHSLYRDNTSVTGYLLGEVWQGDSLSSATVVAVSDTFPCSNLTTSATDLTITANTPFTFSTEQYLEPNAKHWFVINYSNVVFDASDGDYIWAVQGQGHSFGGTWNTVDGNTWSLSSSFNYAYSLELWADTVTAAFTGIIIGDTPTNDTNVVTFNAQPLSDLFRQYPARLLDGYTSTGMTASQFVESVRDHTDGAGNFVFRPFFGNSTTGWNIQTTTVNYGELTSKTSQDVIDNNVWQVLERLAQAETFVPYVDKEGVFNFVARADASATTFEFHGAKSFDREYGRTIKKITAAGPKYSKYYSRVNVRWDDAFTATSVETVEASFEVSADNLPWIYGHKTFDLTNRWIQSASVAAQIAQTIFDDVSALKNELAFTATFVPQLEIFDRISVTYNNNEFSEDSLWDLNKWSRPAGTESIVIGTDDLDNASTMFNPSWYFAQPFDATTAGFIVTKVRVPLFYPSTPSTLGGYIIPEIWTDAGSLPSAMLYQGDTATLVALDLTATNAHLTSTSTDNWSEMTFGDGVELTPGTRYHFVLRPDYVETADISWQTYSNTTLEIGKNSFSSGTSWGNSSRAFAIEMYAYDGPVEAETNLIWDEEKGDSLKLEDDEYGLLKVELDLDKLETKIVAREAT